VGVTGREAQAASFSIGRIHAERRNFRRPRTSARGPGGELLDRPVGLMALEAGLRPGVEPLTDLRGVGREVDPPVLVEDPQADVGRALSGCCGRPPAAFAVVVKHGGVEGTVESLRDGQLTPRAYRELR